MVDSHTEMNAAINAAAAAREDDLDDGDDDTGAVVTPAKKRKGRTKGKSFKNVSKLISALYMLRPIDVTYSPGDVVDGSKLTVEESKLLRLLQQIGIVQIVDGNKIMPNLS